MKIIPAIDLMEGKVVRLFQGDPAQKTIYSDNPVGIAKRWESLGADMLHIVDLDATLSVGSNTDIIKTIMDETLVPVQVAGGLRSESVISDILKTCSRVVIGTLAFQDVSTLKKLASQHGHEKIVISVDHKNGKIVTHGWQQETGVDLIDSMKEFLGMGFTEFLLTNVSTDGTMQGPDLDYMEKACMLENSNVVASGGISNISDVKAVREKNPYGVILGRALYENKITIQEAKKFA